MLSQYQPFAPSSWAPAHGKFAGLGNFVMLQHGPRIFSSNAIPIISKTFQILTSINWWDLNISPVDCIFSPKRSMITQLFRHSSLEMFSFHLTCIFYPCRRSVYNQLHYDWNVGLLFLRIGFVYGKARITDATAELKLPVQEFSLLCHQGYKTCI